MNVDVRKPMQEVPIKVQMQQGYSVKMKLNIVSTRSIPTTTGLQGCQSRQGATRRDPDPLDLSGELIAKLVDADKLVTGWLAGDGANARAFLDDPILALQRAGVKLDRAELKAIARTREAIAPAEVVTPGLKLRSTTVAVSPSSKLKRVVKADGGCDCNNQRKEK